MIPSKILECIELPTSKGCELEQRGDSLFVPETEENFPFLAGVPSLLLPINGEGNDISNNVKKFYEENPFPNYEGLEDFGELVNKGSENLFSSQLLEAIGFNKLVLECGCGTGQLSHYLQLNNNNVLGIDMSLSSLKLAIDHKIRNGLMRSSFIQMNMFDLAIKDNCFDVVIAHGCLHHTFDARRAFSQIVKKLKPGGIIIAGLYNRYARIPTFLRSKLIRIFGPNIDYVVRTKILDKHKADTWIKDQYFNPHETWHSIDEVLKWFSENDIDYLNVSPAILGTKGETAASMFSETDPGTLYQRLVTQLSWINTIAREGGLFDVIGRRKS